MEIVFSRNAKREMQEASAWYETQQEGLGREFLGRLEQASRTIAQDPNRCRLITNAYRRCLLMQFPYGIIYRVDDEIIFVAAVMHLHRKPEYWLK
jgi:plasmid stabilization system protein ParE|tara:strand:+ start:141 stop:425 length:285 start_codon:yes stop_codon:yes gene_type:complete